MFSVLVAVFSADKEKRREMHNKIDFNKILPGQILVTASPENKVLKEKIIEVNRKVVRTKLGSYSKLSGYNKKPPHDIIIAAETP